MKNTTYIMFLSGMASGGLLGAAKVFFDTPIFWAISIAWITSLALVKKYARKELIEELRDRIK